MINRKSTYLTLIVALLLLVPLALIALSIGRMQLSLGQTWAGLIDPKHNTLYANILYDIRLPRVLGAMVIGAALASSGIAFQNLFNNPLVSPDLLGVSNGAAVGAALAILLNSNLWVVQGFALIGGILAVSITILIPRLVGQGGTLILVLSGIIISGFMQAALGLLKYLADPDSQLQSIVYWQLGSIAKLDIPSLLAALPMMIIGFIILIFFRWHLTIMSLGGQTAASQGINIERERLVIILAATLLTAGAVCLAGTIGWIGLVVPHIARRLIGDNARFALPLAAIFGAAFLLVIDTLARTMSAGEIPLSIVTGFIGTPVFIYILAHRKDLIQ
ncbi:FecCD family ABC transporter permease [Limosilactobacillus fermentum]|uniref:Iron ABC transporter permease n=1 Tax=Limosilactobacillus fermentum TaxID=1613 RepID=A0ABD0AM14_LIMFE|nr:iron ABC transporter permease [Limosilactobacillus fermentum]MBD9349461.1 iron ABC transporter permease [Limosilactobacillus fermentum]PHI33042.1 peptide ABC transporter substrate-binding protein [Limosilactobacillus fermentum]GIC72483.1 iron ABC transporter permease [Limosilactobacillus fermentum]